MIKTKDIPGILNCKFFRRVRFMTPSIYFLKAEHIFRFLYDNGTGFMILMELLWMFSIQMFYDLVVEYKIKHLVHLLRVIKAMKNSVREWVDEAFEECPIVRLTLVRYLVTELARRKLSPVVQLEFFNWSLENYKQIFGGDKIVLDRVDFDVLFNRWVSGKQKAKTYIELEHE